MKANSCAVAAALLVALAAPAAAQQVYPSPEAAMKDLIDSAKSGGPDFGERIFGKKGIDLLRSGDNDEDARRLKEFNEAAAQSAELETPRDDERVLRLGANGWTFPVPLVKTAAGWAFDAEAGKQEIIDRLVGHDELSAIAACRAYVKAQDDYFRIDRDNDGLREYARRIISTPGSHDGLYWAPTDQADIAPLGDLTGGVTDADARFPLYRGYRYKILTAQGPSAPGGAHPFLINGHMIAGHALVAWPDQWGKTGVLTFICGENGKVYEKNLGPRTVKLGEAMNSYDPDRSWKLAD
jgi:hypothetical protein